MGLKQIGISEMGILSSGRIKANRMIISIPLVLSAEITQADQDEVVITFDQALDGTSVPATTAFAIAGKTISNVAILGATVTLTVTAVFEYGDVVTVNYTVPVANMLLSLASGAVVESLVNQAVTNNILYPIILDDGNTLRWYDFTDAATKTSVGGFVQALADKSGNGMNLSSVATRYPVDNGVDGVTGDGINDRLINVTALGIDGICSLYIVARIDTWLDSRSLIQSAFSTTTAATIRYISLGGWNPTNVRTVAPAVGQWFLATGIGANVGNSSTQINNNAAVSGASPHAAPVNSYFMLSNDTNPFNLSLKHVIVRLITDTPTTISLIKNYLNRKHTIY